MTALTKDFTSVPSDDNEDEVPISRDRVRDENQLRVDKDAKELETAWAAAGKPTHEVLSTKAGFKKAAKVVYLVDKKDRTAVKGMIRRACTQLKGIPVYVKDVTQESGDIRIKWTFAPLPPKTEKPKTETPVTADVVTPDPTQDATATHEAQAGQIVPPASEAKRGGLLRR